MALNGRAVMLALAENEAVKRTLVQNGMSKGMVQRFVAGETLDDALGAARRLQTQQINTALDLLGENVATEAEAAASTDAYIGVLTALADAKLPSPYISIKLTAIGLDLGDALAADNLRRILTAASAYPEAFVRVDMEGSAYTQRTLDIVRAAHRDFGNVGTVLQSYLRRTDDDLAQMNSDGISVRLVKGAYAEPATVAYPEKADVDAAYVRQSSAFQTLSLSSKCCSASGATCRSRWPPKAIVSVPTSPSAFPGIRTSCAAWPSAPPTLGLS